MAAHHLATDIVKDYSRLKSRDPVQEGHIDSMNSAARLPLEERASDVAKPWIQGVATPSRSDPSLTPPVGLMPVARVRCLAHEALIPIRNLGRGDLGFHAQPPRP